MTEIEALGFYGAVRFTCNDDGDLQLENIASTTPHGEIFNLEQDLPF